jgi:hypothetical protein
VQYREIRYTVRARIERNEWAVSIHPAGIAADSRNDGHKAIHAFCDGLSLCGRGHSVFHENQWWNVYCFAESGHAEKFTQRFGGEKFDPTQRGKGSNWARWNR